jgi:hypothetical protein
MSWEEHGKRANMLKKHLNESWVQIEAQVREQAEVVGGGEDVVNHPAHYNRGGFACDDIIEAFGLGFRLGNVVKYVLRHDKKGNPLRDLEKARWYLDREIEKRKRGT